MTYKTRKYELIYLTNDDAQLDSYTSQKPVYVGDVIEIGSNGFHCVVNKIKEDSTSQLELSKNASSPIMALYFAVQLGHISEH
jgi:hypothetical protein